MDVPNAGPVSAQERIVTLDVLRAFALLGILVMNMPGFYASFWSPIPPHERWPATPDRIAWWVMDTFFSGKFNSLFAFLFGVGFTIQLERLMARAAHPVATYLRRLFVLFLIGVAHGLLLWTGDVLHVYAVLGVILVLLRRTSDRVVLTLIVVGLLTPVLFSVHQLFTYTAANEQSDRGLFGRIDQLVVHAQGQGSYLDVVRSNVEQYKVIYSDIRGYLFYPALLNTILLGFYFGRRRYLQDAGERLDWWRRLARVTFIVGIVSAVAFSVCVPFLEPFKPSWLGVLVTLAYNIQRPALMLFYASALVLLVHSERVGTALRGLAPMGRMPLTNYLMQSLICTTIFNAYGFGFFGRIGPAGGFVLAFVIYALQVIWSRWYFTRFEFGPMEWLWRVLTYGHRPRAVTIPAEGTRQTV